MARQLLTATAAAVIAAAVLVFVVFDTPVVALAFTVGFGGAALFDLAATRGRR